jgi:predicted nucleic acid-binding protein
MSVFIDTSGLLSVLDKDDNGHANATESWVEILSSDELLVTTNYIVLEMFALVQNRLGMKALKLFQEDVLPVLQVEWIDEAMHSAASGILFSASRRKLSLVDCVSFEIMRLHKIKIAFTFDKHFKEQGFTCIPS